MRTLQILCSLFCFLLVPNSIAYHALSQRSQPLYPKGFSHFKWVNPHAPKGGKIVLPAMGSFDTLNPYLLKGNKEGGVSELVFETLTERSLEEPATVYGLLAESIEPAADGLSVTFHLNPLAHFSNGEPVLAEDVRLSFEALTSVAAHPRLRLYWADVKKVEVLSLRSIRFIFKKQNTELPFILGELPVFSRNWGKGKPFSKIVLDTPIGSGPYILKHYTLGREAIYQRNPAYWAQHLGIRKGMYNFETIHYRYVRDDTVRLEGFKAGLFDLVYENVAKQWARSYIGEKFNSKHLLKKHFPHENSNGMQGLVFNLRRPLFQDRRVRKALTLALDFEWMNRMLFYGQYTRTASYFGEGELAASGLPTAGERALLMPFKGTLDPAVFKEAVNPPYNGSPEETRAHLREARRLLEEAGWRVDASGMLKDKQGQPFIFEVLLYAKTYERITSAFKRNLERLGIQLKTRLVDPALYQQRLDRFDYDMTIVVYGSSQMPGNEQLEYHSSQSADIQGSSNYAGIRDPALDQLLKGFTHYKTRQELIDTSRAVDRVLRAGYYVIPNWHLSSHRIAWRNQYAYPAQLPRYYQGVDWVLKSWWMPSQGMQK